MSGDAFTRELFAWLNQVADDRDIPASGFKLAFVIGQHINRQSREAWPTQEALAAAIGASDRTVRTLCERLIERGHLEIKATRGRHRPNIYRLKNRKSASTFQPEKPEASFHLSEQKPEVSFRSARKFDAQKPEASFRATEPSKNHLKEPSKSNRGNQSKDDALAELLTVLDAERAEAVIEHRKKIRKPLTAYAARQLAKKFAQCPDPNEAADTMILRGWQGFEPAWLNNSDRSRNQNSRSLAAGALAAGFDDDGG